MSVTPSSFLFCNSSRHARHLIGQDAGRIENRLFCTHEVALWCVELTWLIEKVKAEGLALHQQHLLGEKHIHSNTAWLGRVCLS
jgi:hypothetical protein